ncbi:hypothetical protein [Spiroplasma endosymbiont of Dactylopius coccus]
MKHLIDFSLFIYDCICINIQKNKFTYKTNKEMVNKIDKFYFDLLKDISKSDNFYKNLTKEKNSGIVDDLKTQLEIKFLYKNYGFKDKEIDQNIINLPIYKKRFCDSKRRFFYIINRFNNDIFIIKPLFLDLNHTFYFNSTRDNIKYEICLSCNNEKC